MTIGGPLFQLSLFGSICICFEKEEDRKARQALRELRQAGQRVSWFTKATESTTTSVANGARKLLGGLFGGSNKASSVTPTGDSSIVEACLVFRDNEEHVPELFVDPKPRPGQPSVGYKLNIALYRIYKIEPNETTGEIRLFGKQPSDPKQSPRLLLMIGLLKGDDQHGTTPAIAEDRDSFVHNLSVLCEWERQRRHTAGIDEQDNEDEMTGNFLTQRAQKAAHFAKREIELQQTKRDREKRKAKLVSESGGLKYTALAMANRED